MKKLILITLVLTVAMGTVWLPSVAAEDGPPYPITIEKTIPAGGPIEAFTFEAWRDMNNNGVIDCVDPWCDVFVGQVVIAGAGTGVIDSPYKGATIIHEVLIAGSAYEQLPDQIVGVPCGDVTFNNEVEVQELGELVILKQDGSGSALAGATFVITPDPKTGAGAMTLVDNGLNDEAPLNDGVLVVTDCIIGTVCTVQETVAPPGYELAPPQTVTISATVTLTFVNTPEKGELIIRKVDGAGDALAGATFVITPDPKTAAGSLTVVDNGLNDEDPAEGVLLVTDCIIGTVCTVQETVAPPGYELAPPQTVTISATVTLTFVNTPELSCGTVCAAQTAPGEYLFGGGQSSWFTWIYYYKGWGTESDPYEYPIYTGITTLCGTLYVYDDGTHIFVNYVLTDTDTCTLAGLSEYHLQIDETFDDLKKHIVNKPGNPVPGKCKYKGTFDPMVAETGWIETIKHDISGWSDPIYIFAHGVGCYYCP